MIIITLNNRDIFDHCQHLLKFALFKHMIISFINDRSAFIVDCFFVVFQVLQIVIYIRHFLYRFQVLLVFVFILEVPRHVNVLALEFTLFLFEGPNVD
jgi:hypothetical protein